MTITTPLGNTIDPVEVVTPEYLEARIAAATPTDIITRTELHQAIANIDIPDLPSNLITEHELEHRLTQLPAPEVTQHDVDLAAQAVDAKFDMLRSAIREATDFDTLKVRLLAVLGN